MAVKLKVAPQVLDNLLGITNKVPPSVISNAGKFSTFRRALKLALKPYHDGIEAFMGIYRKDFEELQKNKQELEKDKKKTTSIDKAMTDLQTEANGKMEEYLKDNPDDIEVTFDNEAYNYTKEILGESVAQIFSMTRKKEDGTIISEQYDANAADELFELLDSAK